MLKGGASQNTQEINASTTEEASGKQLKFISDLGINVESKLTKYEAKMLIQEGLKKRAEEKSDKTTDETEDKKEKTNIEIHEETTDALAKAYSDKVNTPQKQVKQVPCGEAVKDSSSSESKPSPDNVGAGKSPSDTMNEFINEKEGEEEFGEDGSYL